jgi:hypothetical protein
MGQLLRYLPSSKPCAFLVLWGNPHGAIGLLRAVFLEQEPALAFAAKHHGEIFELYAPRAEILDDGNGIRPEGPTP